MFGRWVVTLSIAAIYFSATACGGSYHVVRSAEPNPFSCRAGFVVAPITYEGLEVGKKTETEYLSDKSEETRRDWDADKKAMGREFSRSLIQNAAHKGIRIDASTTPGAAGHFVIQPRVGFVEPGFFGGPAMHSSEVRMTVVIQSPDGRPLDEIRMENETLGSIAYPSTRSRFERDGEKLGESLAEYLNGRVIPSRGRHGARDGACRVARNDPAGAGQR